jgi:hypothetical protein
MAALPWTSLSAEAIARSSGDRHEMQLQEKTQWLTMQPNNLQLKALGTQSPGQGRHHPCAKAIHVLDAGKVEDDIFFCFRETIDVGPNITEEGCVSV